MSLTPALSVTRVPVTVVSGHSCQQGSHGACKAWDCSGTSNPLFVPPQPAKVLMALLSFSVRDPTQGRDFWGLAGKGVDGEPACGSDSGRLQDGPAMGLPGWRWQLWLHVGPKGSWQPKPPLCKPCRGRAGEGADTLPITWPAPASPHLVTLAPGQGKCEGPTGCTGSSSCPPGSPVPRVQGAGWSWGNLRGRRHVANVCPSCTGSNRSSSTRFKGKCRGL